MKEWETQSFGRRGFLKLCGGAGVALATVTLWPVLPAEAASSSWTSSGPFPKAKTYSSASLLASFAFMSVGFSWRAKAPASSNVTFSVRTSGDGAKWSSWVPVVVDDDERDPDPERAFGRLLIVSPSAYLQYKAVLAGGGDFLSGVLREVRIDYFDTRTGPKNGQIVQGPSGGDNPPIMARAGWGADESSRYSDGVEIWPRAYKPVKKIIIHHTATRNGEADPAATVRSIYRYHAITRGWGDIGYNYLVDRNGSIYEGRAGGDDVIGGHAGGYNSGTCGIGVVGDYETEGISPAAQDALSKLIAWICAKRGIDPSGKSNFADLVNLPNVAAHRDLQPTGCPGAILYKQLPAVRKMSGGGSGDSEPEGPPAVEIVAVSFSPLTVLAGDSLRVDVQVKSTGAGKVPTQDPGPGITYQESDSFKTLGFPKIEDRFRVAIDFSGNEGLSHPYRWGLGEPLAPGKVTAVTGYIKVNTPQVRQYWAGIIEEYVKYWQDGIGQVNVSVVNNPAPRAPKIEQEGVLYFEETGHNLGWAFRRHWEWRGGLMMFGYPLTEEFPEVSLTDGQVYSTQYFERARFEHHPANVGTDFEVLLGLLGKEMTVGRDFATGEPFQSTHDRWFFPEVGHSLSFTFLEYWLRHGGLDVFGYPISEEFDETNPTDGKVYTVQYFERNRFEYHPENEGTEHAVLLGQLGREALLQKGWLT